VLVVCLIVAFIIGGVAPTRAIAQTEQAKEIPPSWLQVNADGFGEYNWQIPCMEAFGEYLYAGSWFLWWDEYGEVYTKAQIWRTEDDQNWEKVLDLYENGISELTVFKEYLYAGSWGPMIWRSKDGLTWETVVADGFGDLANGIAHMAVYKENLYASTWNWETGTEIWRTADGTHWQNFVDEGLTGDPNNGGAISSEIFQAKLYWGTANTNGVGADLWQTDGKTMEAIVTDGFGSEENSVISSLATFGSFLYAGVGNINGNIQVWRSANGKDWKQVYFTDETLLGVVNSLEVYREHLYLVMENYLSGVEVWRTRNGIQWEQVGFDGFGDPNNQTIFFDNGTTI
jgi:hypothetical protein